MEHQVVVVGVDTAPGQLHRAAVGTGARAGIGAQVRAVGCWTPIVARRVGSRSHR